MEQSFAGLVVERMMSVSDAAATGVGRALERVTGIRTDSSADKGLWVVLRLVIEIVDAGEHCLDKYYSDTWPAERRSTPARAVTASGTAFSRSSHLARRAGQLFQILPVGVTDHACASDDGDVTKAVGVHERLQLRDECRRFNLVALERPDPLRKPVCAGEHSEGESHWSIRRSSGHPVSRNQSPFLLGIRSGGLIEDL